jgi:hypothetical protein
MAFLMKIAVAGGTGLTRRNRVAGLAEYRATHGNLGALIAARDLDDETRGGHHVVLLAIDGRDPRIRRQRMSSGCCTSGRTTATC